MSKVDPPGRGKRSAHALGGEVHAWGCRTGLLHRRHRGVFALGHRPPRPLVNHVVHDERDRAKDAKLAVGGYRVVRFTHRQVLREPRSAAATLSALLDAQPVRSMSSIR